MSVNTTAMQTAAAPEQPQPERQIIREKVRLSTRIVAAPRGCCC